MKRLIPVFEINPTPKQFGIVAFILYIVSMLIVIFLLITGNISGVFAGVVLFILGGFCGRSIEKRNKKIKLEAKKDVSKRMQPKLG